MDATATKVITTCRGMSDEPREIDGDRTMYRVVRGLFRDAIGFVEHAEGIRAGDIARPTDTAVGPPTRADWDTLSKFIYGCTRLLLSEDLREYHHPGQDTRVTEHNGATLWAALEADYGDTSLKSKDSSAMMARIVGVEDLQDGAMLPSAAIRLIVNANRRLPDNNRQTSDNMRTIIFRMLPPCLSSKVDLWEDKDPPPPLHDLLNDIRQAESKYPWTTADAKMDDISPPRGLHSTSKVFLSPAQHIREQTKAHACNLCGDDCPRNKCKMKFCRHYRKRMQPLERRLLDRLRTAGGGAAKESRGERRGQRGCVDARCG